MERLDRNSILKRIISIRKDLTLEDVESLIKKRREEYGDFLSEEGASRLVAQDLFVDLEERKEVGDEVQIKNLVDGLNDVSVSGIVILAWPPHRFQRKDNSNGVMVKILLADKTGTVQCIIWDPSDQMIKMLSKTHGMILKILHGYTKLGLMGNIELHVGRKASVLINPSTIKEGDLPNLNDFFTDLLDVRDGEKINIKAKIIGEKDLIKFEKFERKGKVFKAKIFDSSCEAMLLAWDEQSERLVNVPSGSVIHVMNCRAKVKPDGRREVHVGKGSIVYI